MIETIALCLFLVALPLEQFNAMGVTVLKLAGGLALGGWLIGRPRARDPIRWDTGATLMLLFLFWGAASYFWSIDPGTSMDKLQTYALLLVTYFLITNVVRGERELPAAMTALWVGMVVLVISGVIGMSAIQANNEDSRLAGVEGNPNGYVALIMACVPACYWLFTRAKARLYKAVVAASLLVAAVTSFYAKSRGGFISTVIFFLSLLAFRQTRRRAVGFAVLFSVLTFRLAPLGLWQRLDESRQRGNVRTTTLWPAGLKAFGQRPWFGSGLGTNLQALSRVRGGKSVVHNSPLAVAIELGIVGLTLYCGLLAYCTVRLWRAIASAMRQGRTREAGFAIVLLASFFGYMTTWFKGGGMEAAKMVWVLLGFMSAYAHILEQTSGATGPIHNGRA
jgi:O-antigen ligase